MKPRVTPETIPALAAAAGIAVADEDASALAAGLGDHLAALDELTTRLDLANVDPAVAFDARWA